MAWTEDRVEMLKKLWAEGLSASQIATKMGGVTRNAVIGKVHRLGLSGRATPAKPQLGRIEEKPPVITKRFSEERPSNKSLLSDAAFMEPLVLQSGDKTTVPTLSNNMCKWPNGDPSSADFHFCGQPASTGRPYCAFHANLAFQPSQRRERPAARQKVLPGRSQRAIGG